MADFSDWVFSPLDTAQKQWASMIADWDAREQQATSEYQNLVALGDAAVAISHDEWLAWSKLVGEGYDSLQRMHDLDTVAGQVKSWFAANPGQMGVIFPVAAAVAVVSASAAFAAVGYWIAQSVQYQSQLNARYQIFTASKASGATDSEAIQAANDAVPAIPTSGASANISEWLMIVAAIILLPKILESRK